MAVTQNTYVGNGTTTQFSFGFTYLNPSHVKAEINGTPTTAFTFFNTSTLQFNVAPANGAAIKIYRETPSNNLLADYTPGSSLREQDLELTLQQVLNVSQETQTFAENQSTAGLQTQITTANNNASTAVTTANAASATANSATATANGLAASIATANTNASAAVATANAADATANNAQAAANAALPLAGGTLTGNLNLPSINGGPLAGFRNAIINGNFDIWQRGTSFTGNEYGADRWTSARSGTTCTMSRQAFALGQTNVPGEPTYFCRMAVGSVAGAGNYSLLLQRIEGVRTFAGQQVVVSFWAKADAAKPITVELEQGFGSGGSPSSLVTSIGVTKTTLSTSWQKVTVTATVPSISGKTLGSDGNDYFQLNIWLDAGSNWNSRTSSLGQQSGTFDIAQVQIEPGPVATPFERRPIGTELALCQRYYEKGTSGFTGYAAAGIGVGAHVSFAATKRASPTIATAPFSYTNASGSNTVNITVYGFIPFGTTTALGGVIVYNDWTASAEL